MKYFLNSLFALLMLFACSVQDVVNEKASEITVSGNDFDVGYHFTETSAALTADYSKAPDFFDSHGYGHSKPQLWAHIEEITIGRGNPEWGAPDRDVFIIKLGAVFHTKNLK